MKADFQITFVVVFVVIHGVSEHNKDLTKCGGTEIRLRFLFLGRNVDLHNPEKRLCSGDEGSGAAKVLCQSTDSFWVRVTADDLTNNGVLLSWSLLAVTARLVSLHARCLRFAVSSTKFCCEQPLSRTDMFCFFNLFLSLCFPLLLTSQVENLDKLVYLFLY